VAPENPTDCVNDQKCLLNSFSDGLCSRVVELTQVGQPDQRALANWSPRLNVGEANGRDGNEVINMVIGSIEKTLRDHRVSFWFNRGLGFF
jgi:hypothetical protein